MAKISQNAKTKKPSARARAESPNGASSSAPEAEGLPGPEEITLAFAPVRGFAAGPEYARIRGFLERLAERPPQVLLLEGGTAQSRLAAAHYWSLLLNCSGGGDAPAATPAPVSLLPGLPGLAPPTPEPAPAVNAPSNAIPCLECSTCIRMVTHLHRDCFFLNGAEGSIKIDDVRAVRSVLGEPPRESAWRVVIFHEAQALVEAAANALLKSFEEPRPGTSFVMLAPQRERLLPTLVSRSFVLTLPWPLPDSPAEQADETLVSWEAALCVFLRTGQGFLDRSGTRGAVDASLVHGVCSLVRRSLAGRILALQDGRPPAEGIEELLGKLPEARLRMLDEALAECQESLIYGVNPTLVLEWLATRMYLLLPRGRRQAA